VSTVVVSVLGALVVGGACLFGPQVIRRLPEPPAPEDEEDETPAGSERTDSPMARATDYVKVPYAELATRPNLAIKLGLVGLVVGAVIGAVLSDEPIVAAWLFLGVVGVWLAYVDAQTRLLPTRIIAPAYGVLALLILLAAAIDGDTADLVRAVLGWAVYGGFYFLMWFIYPRGLGYGDVRLAGLLGLALGYLGWGQLLVGMYAGFLLGGVIGAVLALARVVDRKRYPFGPFMLVGAIVGLVAGAPFADWYTGV
jgi:leader peptidase (prepilin peptidase) / N-methyltransferase